MRTSICFLLASSLAWAQTPSQQPVFRTSSILVRADVIVTDKNDRRIHGLTPADFIVRAQGVLQQVSEFEHVLIRSERRNFSLDNPPAPQPRQFSNFGATTGGRTFVFMIGTISGAYIVQTKRVLTEFLNTLSPDDLVGVSYHSGSHLGVDFTSDPALIARSFSRVGESIGGVPGRGYEWFQNVIRSMHGSRHTRRVIVFVSEKAPFLHANPKDLALDLAFTTMLGELKRAAQLNIPIYTMDPRGLMAPELALEGPMEQQTPERRKAVNQAVFFDKQSMKTLAENTGGRAFTDSWDGRNAARTLLTDNNDYYVLGIRPEPYNPDGKFHELDIRVRIPGARVRSRQGYIAEPLATALGPLSEDDALSQGMPGGDLKLVGDAVVEPVAGVPGNVRLALRVQYDGPAVLAAKGDELAVRWIAIDADASIRASGEETAQVPATTPIPLGGVPVDMRLEIPRGRSTIRVVVTSAATGTRGWLHIPIQVTVRK
jgi:VWFA-related protein